MGIRLPKRLRPLPGEKTAWIIIICAFIALGLSLWLKRSRLSTNPRSRIATVERLVEARTWAHVSPTDTTPFPPSIDVVKVGDRVYSSKPPNYPLLMAGESILMKSVTGLEFYPHKIDYLRMLVILNQIIPYTIMLFVVLLFLREFTDDPWTRNFMLLAMSIGLLPFGYASTINNHTVSAVLFFISFYLVYRITYKNDERWWMYALVGLLTGFGITIELPGGVFGVWFLFLLARKNPMKAGITFVTMALPFLPSFYIYKMLSGSYKPFYLQGHLYRYEGSYWLEPGGMDAIRHSRPVYIFNSLLGFKGLFSMTPLFFLSVAGLVRKFRRKDEKMRLEWVGIVLCILAIMYFVWSRTNNYGGDCIGMRWFIPFMPLLMFVAWPVVRDLGKSMGGRILCLALLGMSVPWIVNALHIEAFIVGTFENLWAGIFGWSGPCNPVHFL